jgi:hypothetical protein
VGLLATTIMEVLKRLNKRGLSRVKPPNTFSKDCVEVSKRFSILLEPIGEVRQRARDSARSRISLSCVS